MELSAATGPSTSSGQAHHRPIIPSTLTNEIRKIVERARMKTLAQASMDLRVMAAEV